ncbi:YfiR family protein [Acinetobacter cumulans]|uniref:YfiR family protein n=1 Tax=Acinetobacter cumulans TaxID=2136182 RepID=UPI001D197BFB|nr:YfiR family protein [Acinetobacter cumulans]
MSSSLYAAPVSDIYHTSLAILSYAKWPTNTPEICVVNNNTFAQQLKNNLPADSPYKVSNKHSSELRSSNCTVLFFSNLSDKEEQNILNTAVNYPALSISSNNLNCETGSAFCLYKKNQSYAFKVNMESLTQSKIHIDPRVLMLAKPAESNP